MIVTNLITTLDGKEVMVDFFTAEVTQNRTIHIIGEINDDTASYICSEIRYLSRNSKEPLTLILNSPEVQFQQVWLFTIHLTHPDVK